MALPIKDEYTEADLAKMTDDEINALLARPRSVRAAPTSALRGGGGETAPVVPQASAAPAEEKPANEYGEFDPTAGMSGPELFVTGMGQRAAEMGSGLEQAARATAREVTRGRWPSDESQQAFNTRLSEAKKADRRLLQHAAARWGASTTDLAPMILGGVGYGAGRALAVPALLEAARPAEEWLEVVGRLGRGALGGLLGYGAQVGLSKGVNSLRGNWGEFNDLRNVDRWAREHGVNLSASDLNPEGKLRHWEDFAPSWLSFGQARGLRQQAEGLNQLINRTTPQGGYENALATAVRESAKELDDASATASTLVRDMAKVNKTTNVTPKELVSGVQAYIAKYGTNAFDHVIKDVPLRNKIIGLSLASDPALVKMPFNEMRDIQKALFGVKQFGESLNKSSAIPKEQAAALESLYNATHKDFARWGVNGRNQKTYAAYLKALEQYKRTVVPFTDKVENPVGAAFVSGRRGRGAYENRPAQMIDDILNPKNKENVAQVEALVSPDAANALRTVRLADRAARKVAGHRPQGTSGMGLLGAGYFAAHYPGAVATGVAGEEALNSVLPSRLFKSLYMADPTLLRNDSYRGALRALSAAPEMYGSQWMNRRFEEPEPE